MTTDSPVQFVAVRAVCERGLHTHSSRTLLTLNDLELLRGNIAYSDVGDFEYHSQLFGDGLHGLG